MNDEFRTPIQKWNSWHKSTLSCEFVSKGIYIIFRPVVNIDLTFFLGMFNRWSIALKDVQNRNEIVYEVLKTKFLNWAIFGWQCDQTAAVSFFRITVNQLSPNIRNLFDTRVKRRQFWQLLKSNLSILWSKWDCWITR